MSGSSVYFSSYMYTKSFGAPLQFPNERTREVVKKKKQMLYRVDKATPISTNSTVCIGKRVTIKNIKNKVDKR